VVEKGTDKKNVEVERRYRLVNKHKNGKAWNQVKFTVNCYHTSTSYLINGSRLDLFTKFILPNIQDLLQHSKNLLNNVNSGIHDVLEGGNTPTNEQYISEDQIVEPENNNITDDQPNTLKSRSFSQVSSIKTFDFATLYTTLPHDKLKTHLKETIHKAFSHRNYGSEFVVMGYNSTYFSNKIQKGKTCYSEEQVISMMEFIIDNIFVSFGGTLFQQVVGIPMGTNCALLQTDLFLYSYESEFLQKLVKDKKMHEARAFNFTYRYIDDVLSINNSRFSEFLPLIYPPELEVKETTDTASSASFLELYLEFDDSGQLSTKIYDKRDDFNFKIINFPNMCSNIPASPAYGVYISQLIRYARANSNYSDFLKRHLHLRNRLLDQGY
jgi:hypothetical protein